MQLLKVHVFRGDLIYLLAVHTCLTVVHDLLVEAVEVFGVAREGHPVARHGVPAAHGEEATLVVLPHQVLQHRPVVDEGMQVTGKFPAINIVSINIRVM